MEHLHSWQRFDADASELAARIRRRFAANLHHVIGTIRVDGSPRLSGTEVTFRDGEIVIGMMPDSRKLADVERDPRVEVHSAPLEDDLGQGDAKLSGELVAAEAGGPIPGSYLRLGIRRASLVRVIDDELVLTVWSGPGRTREIRRA